ncbi:PepSY domain-containing protein [Phreatobacter sp. HK31-P]
MKRLLLLTSSAVFTAGLAMAQTTPPATPPAAAPPAATSPATPPAATERRAVNAAPLENGANSFTEGQARGRFEEAGITGVTDLTKDDNGIWRGRGQWNGRAVTVGLDFRGNISAQ